MKGLCIICLLAMVQAISSASLPPPLNNLEDTGNSGGETTGEVDDSLPELEVSEEEPVWIHGDKPDGFEETIQERLQSRMAALKEQFEALNETEKEEIKQRAIEMRAKMAMMDKPDGFEETIQEGMQSRMAALKEQFEALNETEREEIQQRATEMRAKIAMMSPTPMMCPPPEDCDCEDDEDEEDENEEEDYAPQQYPHHGMYGHQFNNRHQYPHNQNQQQYPPHGMYGNQFHNHHQYPHNQNQQQFHQSQNYQFQHGQNSGYHAGYIQPMHGPINPQAQNLPTQPLAESDESEQDETHRGKRDLARLRKTFSVTNPNEWWQDIDFGRGNAVSDSIASWDLGAATQHSISSAMDHYAPALHIGTINRGSIMHPAMGGPADRIFGYNPDFNRQDHHAFKFKPRGQFQNYANKPLEYFKNMKYLPAGAEFFYNPNPQLRPALTGVGVNPGDKSVYSDKYLSGHPGQNLPRGTYKMEWIQLVPTADKTKVQGFNMVVKNSQTGKHFRLDNADVNQFQGASPYRQQFNRVGHQWGGAGLAQGPAGSVYDRNLQGYRIDSGQNYHNNYYGMPHYYNRWGSQLPSKI